MFRDETLVINNDAEKPRTYIKENFRSVIKASAKPPAASRKLFEGVHMMARERRFILSFR